MHGDGHRARAQPGVHTRADMQLFVASCPQTPHMKNAIFGFVLATLAFTASAQTLWGGAPIGASPAEVKTLMPEAQETSAERRASDNGLLLEIPRYELAGESFAVSFLFASDRLQSVVLETQPLSVEKARALTRELGDSLRKRYGLDVSTRSRRFTVREGIVDREWLYRRISVRLQHLNDHAVRLTYSSEAPSPTPSPSRGL